LELARMLSRSLGAPLFYSKTSRLLVELNRTLGHRQLFSEFSRPLDERERAKLIEKYYRPYREAVENRIAAALTESPVLHVSVHSFTPVMRGYERPTDLGLLFDPARMRESAYCHDWRLELRKLA